MASWYQSLVSKARPSAAHIWQPRNTSSVVISKGLLNAPGENNCFLNSAVQVLWHLDVFRRSFREIRGHACMGKACIFCALKVLFTQLQYSEQQSLPPDALRKALAVAFQDEHRFQLGFMDDAAECFENILTRIHFHLAYSIKEELCDAKHCIPHKKFAMTLIEHSVCTCGATSEPFPFTQMVHYVSCTALCAESKKLKEKCRWSSSVCFGQVLRNAGAIGDIRDCPSECGKKIKIRRVLTNFPDVVSIGLVWDSDRPEKEHILDVIQCLGTSLRMPDLFNAVVDDGARQAALHIVGVVTYYGKHYSTFFYNTALRVWVYFDDSTVKQVGPNWRDVVRRCKRGHTQPLLLLFANPNGSPVPTETAPQESTILQRNTQSMNLTGAKPPRQLIDSIRSGNSRPISALQSVRQNISQNENHANVLPHQNVIEIGHDALKTIPMRNNGLSPVDRHCKIRYKSCQIDNSQSSGKVLDDKQSVHVKDTPGGSSICFNQLRVERNASPAASPYSENTGAMPHKISENNATFSIRNRIGIHHDEGNMLLMKTGRIQLETNDPASSDKLFNPRKLERHESWSGRPSQLTCRSNINLLQPYTEIKCSFEKHNQSCQIRQPQEKTHSLGQEVSPLESHPLSKCSVNKQLIPQFSSVPNLHTDKGLHSHNSSHVLNFALAKEGILANAMKNNVQYQRTSVCDLLSSSKRNNKSSNPYLMSDSIIGSGSLSDLIDVQDQLQEKDGKEKIIRQPNKSVIDVGNSHISTIYRQTAKNTLSQMSTNLIWHDLYERDSVGSKDSGYQSRDQFSASSERVHLCESPLLSQNTCSLQDAATMCHMVCAECDEIEAKSRSMRDAGDLASALALCTSEVARLKECLQLEGMICPEMRQFLHTKYNKAVLQSRNLHRCMLLLHKQDSHDAVHHQQCSRR